MVLQSRNCVILTHTDSYWLIHMQARYRYLHECIENAGRYGTILPPILKQYICCMIPAQDKTGKQTINTMCSQHITRSYFYGLAVYTIVNFQCHYSWLYLTIDEDFHCTMYGFRSHPVTPRYNQYQAIPSYNYTKSRSWTNSTRKCLYV